MDPISSFAAAVNGPFRILEVTYQLKAVGEQTADLLSTTKHVDTNLNEARRLRRVKDTLINHGERTWIDAVINDTDRALRAVAQLIEPARVDELTKSNISLGHKVMWVFRDNPKVRDKHSRLSMCHQSLTAVISCLYSKDVVVIAPIPQEKKEEQPPPYDPEMEQLLNWMNPRRRRKSFMSLRDGVQRPMSTDSVSTDTTLVSPMSGFSSPMENVDGRDSLQSLDSAAASITSLLSPLASPRENVVERPISTSSVSTVSRTTTPMGLFAGVRLHDDSRPGSVRIDRARADLPPRTISTVLEQRQMNEEASHGRLPYPMTPSDYSTKDFLAATEQAFHLGTKYLDSDATDHSPQTNEITVNTPNKQDGSSKSCLNTTDTSNAQPTSAAPPMLSEISDPHSTLFESHRFHYDVADGLLVQEIEQVGQQQYTYRSYRPSSASVSSLSSRASMPPSPPPRSYSAGDGLGYRPPRLPANPPYDQIPSIAELAIAPAGADGERAIEGRAGSDGDTGRPLSVVQGSMRRGGRSWLMFHAARSDLGHYSG